MTAGGSTFQLSTLGGRKEDHTIMSKPLILSLIVFIGALICLGIAIFNWNWAMKSNEAKPVIALIGERNTRIFYAILGAGFLVAGVLILTGVLQVPDAK